MNTEFVGDKDSNNFTVGLKARQKMALDETANKSNSKDNRFAIFPESFYISVYLMDMPKTIDYCFIGTIGNNKMSLTNRGWLFDFISEYFTDDSFFANSIVHENHKPLGVFDYTLTYGRKGGIPPIEKAKYNVEYFTTLKKSRFCLCPAGNHPWSTRFFEALMCKSIPIVKYRWEAWRSLEESAIDYKYYLVSDKEFIYREDWAEHNYALFLKYHTLNGAEKISKFISNC